MELQDNTFAYGNSKIDKILNSFANSPFIRIAWVNEMKDVKLDESFFSCIDYYIESI